MPHFFQRWNRELIWGFIGTFVLPRINWDWLLKPALHYFGAIEESNPYKFHLELMSLSIILWVVIVTGPAWWPWFRYILADPAYRPNLTPQQLTQKAHYTLEYLAFSLVLFVLAGSIYLLPSVLGYFENLNTILGWNILHQFAGSESPSGRKRIIEELITQGADLRKIDISNAWLQGLNAENGNLSVSNMGGAKLSKANFRNANLRGSSFTGTDLTEVDFSGSNLSDSAFYGNLNISLKRKPPTTPSGIW